MAAHAAPGRCDRARAIPEQVTAGGAGRPAGEGAAVRRRVLPRSSQAGRAAAGPRGGSGGRADGEVGGVRAKRIQSEHAVRIHRFVLVGDPGGLPQPARSAATATTATGSVVV